jgi:hypothetical protein
MNTDVEYPRHLHCTERREVHMLRRVDGKIV